MPRQADHPSPPAQPVEGGCGGDPRRLPSTRDIGRQVVEGVKRVNVFAAETVVRAQLWTVNGFSAHADQPILINWLKKADAKKIFLVHSGKEPFEGFKEAIEQELSVDAHITMWKESVTV